MKHSGWRCGHWLRGRTHGWHQRALACSAPVPPKGCTSPLLSEPLLPSSAMHWSSGCPAHHPTAGADVPAAPALRAVRDRRCVGGQHPSGRLVQVADRGGCWSAACAAFACAVAGLSGVWQIHVRSLDPHAHNNGSTISGVGGARAPAQQAGWLRTSGPTIYTGIRPSHSFPPLTFLCWLSPILCRRERCSWTAPCACCGSGAGRSTPRLGTTPGVPAPTKPPAS